MRKIFLVCVFITNLSFGSCKLINLQCLDKAEVKTINGYKFTLAQYCSQNGLTGDACCWNSQSNYYCSDSEDTCGSYRKNPNCTFKENTCMQTNPLDGSCLKAQTTFSCASGYAPKVKQICTDAICVNNNNDNINDKAKNCFMPEDIVRKQQNATGKNVSDLGTALAYLEVGKQAASDLQNCKGGDPQMCSIFQGNYYTCDIYNPNILDVANQGADCMIHKDYFDANLAGQNVSDKGMYGSVASDNTNSGSNFASNGNGYRVGDRYSYGLSNQDQNTMNTINAEVQTLQNNNQPLNNKDTNPYINSNGHSRYMSLSNSHVSSVTMGSYASDHIGSWNQYLTTGSATLAWNKIKADPDPFNAKKTTFNEIGVTKPLPNNVGDWGDNKPGYAQGLCLYLSNYNDGGNQGDTDSIAGRAVCLGNSNCGAVCTNRDPVFGICLTASPKPTREEWCCFNSKIAMDVTIAAWDQGITKVYKDSTGKFEGGGNVKSNSGKCGGVTVAEISRIDFSKTNYFKDFQNSLNQNFENMANTASVQGNAQNLIQNRVDGSMQTQINGAK